MFCSQKGASFGLKEVKDIIITRMCLFISLSSHTRPASSWLTDLEFIIQNKRSIGQLLLTLKQNWLLFREVEYDNFFPILLVELNLTILWQTTMFPTFFVKLALTTLWKILIFPIFLVKLKLTFFWRTSIFLVKLKDDFSAIFNLSGFSCELNTSFFFANFDFYDFCVKLNNDFLVIFNFSDFSREI